MSKPHKHKHPSQQSSRLAEHKKQGRELRPPLANLDIRPVRYSIDVLPDFLLIDAVTSQLPWNYAPQALQTIFDLLDQFVPQNSQDILDGTISSMALIPEEQRARARAALVETNLFTTFLPEGFRHALALYPACPAGWLITDWKQDRTVDWEQGIAYLKEAVLRLWRSKDVYSTRVRMVFLARQLAHHRITFPKDMEVVDLLPKYPSGLSEDEQQLVEAWSRATFNALYNLKQDHHVQGWIPYFWRQNYNLSPCQPLSQTGEPVVSSDRLQHLLHHVQTIVEKLSYHVQHATQQAKLDLYDVDKDEVLFGLLGRQYRIFHAIAINPSFWTADLGVMFHRVMVDSLIILKWLIQRNEALLFSRFKQYSLGKQKLHQLHTQDLVDQGQTDLEPLAEELLDEINEEAWEALVSIDLGGNFAGIDMRKMAHEVDLRDTYNLVYSPASADLHGEWSSLKRYNLVRCRNPLHRFHRLPQFTSNTFLFPQAVLRAATIFLDTFLLWVDAYHLHSLGAEAKDIIAELEQVFTPLR